MAPSTSSDLWSLVNNWKHTNHSWSSCLGIQTTGGKHSSEIAHPPRLLFACNLTGYCAQQRGMYWAMSVSAGSLGLTPAKRRRVAFNIYFLRRIKQLCLNIKGRWKTNYMFNICSANTLCVVRVGELIRRKRTVGRVLHLSASGSDGNGSGQKSGADTANGALKLGGLVTPVLHSYFVSCCVLNKNFSFFLFLCHSSLSFGVSFFGVFL